MSGIPIEHGLLLAGILFALGTIGWNDASEGSLSVLAQSIAASPVVAIPCECIRSTSISLSSFLADWNGNSASL